MLTLVARGLSDREIAERIVVSQHTVHRHVANIRRKLGSNSRAAAVAEAAARRSALSAIPGSASAREWPDGAMRDRRPSPTVAR